MCCSQTGGKRCSLKILNIMPSKTKLDVKIPVFITKAQISHIKLDIKITWAKIKLFFPPKQATYYHFFFSS